MLLSHHKTLLSILLCLLITGCATAEQPAKHLDSKATTAKILAKDPTSKAFNDYLVKQGYVEKNLPLNEWGLKELTLSALFFHTKLDVSKKKLGLANLAVQTASVKNNPSINADIARSNQKNGDIKPWSYGLSVDIPIETANKRGIRVEKAQKNTEIARMEVAETAWALRSKIAKDLIAYHQNTGETILLEEELLVQTHIGKMLEKRVRAGIASKIELSNADLLTLKTGYTLNRKRGQASIIKAKLAADVGLSTEKFSLLKIRPLALDESLVKQVKVLEELQTLQAHALLNRIDIRRSVAKYAVAEAEIKLQVAKQTPDITLSPGILFDFGDSIWSLGFSSLLNVLNKNTALIEEAKQLRAIEGAQFEHLQASIIAELNQAHMRYRSTKQTLKHAKLQQAKQLKQVSKMQKQFDAGLIGKVDLKKSTLISVIARQQLLAAKFSMLRAMNQIENIMQKPLYTSFNMPNLNDK